MAGLRSRLFYIYNSLWVLWHGVWAVRLFIPADSQSIEFSSIALFAVIVWGAGAVLISVGLALLTRRLPNDAPAKTAHVDENGPLTPENNFENTFENVLEHTIRRLYRLPLALTVLFAVVWLVAAFVLFACLRLQFSGTLSASAVLVSGIAGAIALPMVVYAVITTVTGPIVADYSERALSAGIPVRGYSPSFGVKLVLLATLFPIGITIWLGGFAYYSGIREMILEIKYSANQIHEFLIHDTLVNEDRLDALRFKLKRAKISYRRDFYLYDAGSGAELARTGSELFRLNQNRSEQTRIFKNSSLATDRVVSYYDAELERLIVCSPVSDLRICSVRGIGEELGRFNSLGTSIAGFVFASISIAGLLAFFFGKIMARSVYRLTSMLAHVEAGRLDERAGAESLDEVGRLAILLSRFFGRLSAKLDEVRFAAEQVDEASQVQSRNAASFSRTAQDQAAATEEATAAMSAMSGAIAEVAGEVREQGAGIREVTSILRGDLLNLIQELNTGARQVSEFANLQVAGARDAEQIATEAVAGMEQVVESSRSIMLVIGTINEISDRTALLSLNASIEAARAGEAGRGFAVVAGEISRLAERSSQATGEVEEIIQQSSQNIAEGASRVRALGTAVQQLRREAARVSESGLVMERLAGAQVQLNDRIQAAMREIEGRARKVAAAEQQQTQTTGEMMKTIDDISDSAQQISLHSQQMAEVIDRTVAQSRALTSAVQAFKFDS